MLVHDFGIIDDIKNSDFEYDLEKYHCVSVHDDYVLQIIEKFNIVKTYFHKLERPNYGLAYHGITIIPTESLVLFENILLCEKNSDFDEVIKVIRKAKKENKYMIHFGI